MLCMPNQNAKFSLNNLIFCQIDGVAIGCPFGLIPANIYDGYYENCFPFSNQVKSSTSYLSEFEYGVKLYDSLHLYCKKFRFNRFSAKNSKFYNPVLKEDLGDHARTNKK